MGKEKVGLGSTCSIPHLPCPALHPSVMLIPVGQASAPVQSKARGAKRHQLCAGLGFLGGCPGLSRSPDAEKCFLALWWGYRNAGKNAVLGCFVG